MSERVQINPPFPVWFVVIVAIGLAFAIYAAMRGDRENTERRAVNVTEFMHQCKLDGHTKTECQTMCQQAECWNKFGDDR